MMQRNAREHAELCVIMSILIRATPIIGLQGGSMPSAFQRVAAPLGRLLQNRRAGDETSLRHRDGLAAARELQISSPSFMHDGTIPERHSGPGRGENTSPALAWSAVPDGTAQMLLVIEDVDVPMKRPIIHTAALFSPTITHFDEGALAPGNADVRYVPTLLGRAGYSGPRPLPGHGPHRYLFHLFALDQTVPAERKLASLDELLPLIDGHVIARGFLRGIQEG
jgi:phosphatidylethanolamine-binding protein (PEBP) family uncharacterized protein